MDLHLYLFYDDVEEIMLIARSKDDAFQVIEETYGEDAADDLIMSQLLEYADEFNLKAGRSAKDFANKMGRGVYDRGRPGLFVKPPKVKPIFLFGDENAV